MKQIKLTQGKFALVDDNTYEAIGHLKWHSVRISNLWYAVREENKKRVYLHHVVAGFPLNNCMIGHKDGNGLNDQRDNLHIVTNRQNQQERTSHLNGKLIGASWHKRVKKWAARIGISGTDKHLGYFDTAQEAHDAYMEALKNVN